MIARLSRLKRKQKLLLAACAAGVLLLALRSGGGSRIEVDTCLPARTTLVESVPASGIIRPVVEVKITPDVSGEVVELFVQEGDRVLFLSYAGEDFKFGDCEFLLMRESDILAIIS